MNISNHGTAIGYVAQSPIVNVNKDGSKKIFLVIAVKDNFKDSKGEKGTQFINLEAFMKKTEANGNGVYDYIYKGSKVGVAYRVESNSYQDAKTKQQVYRQALCITDVELMDVKEVAEKLKARATAEAKAEAKATAKTA